MRAERPDRVGRRDQRALDGADLLNAWFDWNEDGDWSDGGTARCGPEWGIQNELIDPASLGEARVAAVTLRFRTGEQPRQFWWRVQVHQGAPVPHAGSAGQATPTVGGETEDYRFDRRAAPSPAPFALECAPEVLAIEHGGNGRLRFDLVGGGGRKLAVTRASMTPIGPVAGLRFRLRSSGARSWTMDVTSAEKHVRDPVLQKAAVRLTVDARVDSSSRKYRGACTVTVAHARRIVIPVRPPRLTPAIRTPSIPVENPTPETARCRARLLLPGRTSAAVQVRCDGAHPKSWSVCAGSTGPRIVSFSQGKRMTCYTVNVARALRCRMPQPSKGILWGTGYLVDKPFGGTVIHVLAGGFGVDGTTIVLIQNWFVYPDGRLGCSQSVPCADACATL
ncbi:MAG: GEVED domain-containing protein [Actinomycetota bacterium]|nr:GEVED domain-containing protein [Actinomycetota bacterium]